MIKIIMERVLYIRFSYRFVSHDLAVSPPTQVNEGGEGEKERSDSVVGVGANAAGGREGDAGTISYNNYIIAICIFLSSLRYSAIIFFLNKCNSI